MSREVRVTGTLLPPVERQRGTAWYAKYRVPDPTHPSGARQHKKYLGEAWTGRGRAPAGFLTEKQAQERLQALLTDRRRGLDDGTDTLHRGRTFGVACTAWIEYVEHYCDRAPTTVADYRRTVANHLIPWFGADTPVAKIASECVEAFRDHLLTNANLTRVSAAKIMVLLNGVFKRAKRARWVVANPCDDVERIKVKASGDFNVLSAEEVLAVMRAAASPQDRAVFAVAAFSGLRMGEIRALQWRSVDFAGSLLHVRQALTHNRLVMPKSGKVRSTPLTDQAARELDGLSQRDLFAAPGDLVFVNEVGSYLHDGDLRRRFYTALADAGLGSRRKKDDPITFHDLRHTFGTLAVQVWDLPRVQAYMGHADITTTMGYVHHVPRTDDAARLSALVAGAAGDVGVEQPATR